MTDPHRSIRKMVHREFDTAEEQVAYEQGLGDARDFSLLPVAALNQANMTDPRAEYEDDKEQGR